MNRTIGLTIGVALSALVPGHALAQSDTTVLVAPALPDDFDRGRNISVLQRSRPDYDPTGIPVGGFNVLPEVSLSAGYSSNIYYAGSDEAGDGYVEVAPSVRVNSDWSRHSLQFRAGTQVDRYFSNALRNQTPWNTGVVGGIDVSDSLRFIPEFQAARLFESPFTSDTTGGIGVLSSYLQLYGGMRAEYSSGQVKLVASVDDGDYTFSDVTLPNGGLVDQAGRDRNILRTTGQAQYAFTPSVSTYGQFTFSQISYHHDLLGGIANRDSQGYQFIGGLNFDLSGLLRGTIGVGLTHRDFDSPLYRNVTGFSAQAKLEYFPSELTTFTLEASRVLTDASVSGPSVYFDTRGGLRVDHELRRNILLNLGALYSHISYIDSSLSADIYRITGGGTYLVSNTLNLNLAAGFTRRTSGQELLLGQNFKEFQVKFGVTLKR